MERSLLQTEKKGYVIPKKVAALLGCSYFALAGVCVFLAVVLVNDKCISPSHKLGEQLRTGREIMVCGELYYIGHEVVLWTDPGGYDAYRTEQRFAEFNESKWANASALNPLLLFPNRFELRNSPDPDRHYLIDPGYRELTDSQLRQVRGGGWDLPLLAETIDQFVIHYDACGLSKTCFEELQDERDLSVHFMLDLDGTIYQTLDVKERAWHATIANTRAIGIEIANVGAYPETGPNPFAAWYHRAPDNSTKITLPPNNGLRNQSWAGGPIRPDPIHGYVADRMMQQYDFTPEQYTGLSRLLAMLTLLFPKLKLQFPTDASGQVLNSSMSLENFSNYQGVLGHLHVRENPLKQDPGPAFQWDKLKADVERIIREANK